jgi:hypothetical protein
VSIATNDPGAVIFHDQEEANAFCRSNPYFQPTSMHRNWMGRVKCKYCKVAGWVKDVHANHNWTNRHGYNCKKKPIHYSIAPGFVTTNSNFGIGTIYYNTVSGQLMQQGSIGSSTLSWSTINNKYNWSTTTWI